MTTYLKIDQIRTDGGTQPRVALNYEVIEEYIESIQAGAKFPPIDVFYDGEDYWLADGFHRRDAFFGVEMEEIECNVHQGTLQDAQWFSFGANKTNGQYRSNNDKQRAIQAALRHPRARDLSDNAIASHCGVSDKTVAAWRERIFGNSEDARPAARRATRNGREYTIKTANIGRRAAQVVDTEVQEPKGRKSGSSTGLHRKRRFPNMYATAGRLIGTSEGALDGLTNVVDWSIFCEFADLEAIEDFAATFGRLASGFKFLARNLNGRVSEIRAGELERHEDDDREGEAEGAE